MVECLLREVAGSKGDKNGTSSYIAWCSASHKYRITKAIESQCLDSHPNFEKIWGGWVDFIFYFRVSSLAVWET